MKPVAVLFVVCAVLLPANSFRRAAPPALAATFASPEALGDAVLDGFRRRDATALRRLALTEEEFRAHVWPALPVSRPDRNMPFEYVWQDLEAKSRAYLMTNLRRPFAASARVVRVEFDGESTDYGEFTILRASRLVVEDERGAESSVRLFGSVLRQGQRYKLFSFVAD